MNFLLILLGIAFMVAGIAIPNIINKKRREHAYAAATYDMRRNGNVQYTKYKGKAGKVCITIAILLILLANSFVLIPTGYTGVRTMFGQIDSKPVRNGFNWKVPFVQQIERVNNKQQDVVFKDKVWSETSERTAIYYEKLTVTYQINPEMSAWIYANVSDYRSALVSQELIASAVKASSKSLSDVDATNRSLIEPLVQKNAQESLDGKYGARVVVINKVTIDNADFDAEYNDAIAQRQQAVLTAEKQEIENRQAIEKAQAEAIITKTKAEAQANAKLVSAKANADAMLIEANAEAEANKKIRESLTSAILEKLKYERWDGKLPMVSGAGSQIISIDP